MAAFDAASSVAPWCHPSIWPPSTTYGASSSPSGVIVATASRIGFHPVATSVSTRSRTGPSAMRTRNSSPALRMICATGIVGNRWWFIRDGLPQVEVTISSLRRSSGLMKTTAAAPRRSRAIVGTLRG